STSFEVDWGHPSLEYANNVFTIGSQIPVSHPLHVLTKFLRKFDDAWAQTCDNWAAYALPTTSTRDDSGV
ncbi:hypothetical protein HK405_001286, partial [Cladochytrium tenue]